jgi:hypothetical protein
MREINTVATCCMVSVLVYTHSNRAGGLERSKGCKGEWRKNKLLEIIFRGDNISLLEFLAITI